MAQNNCANLTHTQYNVIVGSTNNEVTNVAPSATSGIPLVSNGAAANPSFTTATVAGGGTGTATYTAYSVICAGTTSTGAFQNVSGVGTSGQLLTSNGAGALPTWQANGGGSTFTVTKFTASGTWTKAASTKVVEFIIWAGGSGGGSGRRGLTTAAGGGGGGAGGGVVHMIVPQDFFAASETVTIGGTAAGGTTQSSNSTNGNAGTVGNDSSIGNVVAKGGGVTVGGTTTSAAGGAGKSKYSFQTVASTQSPGGAGGNVTGTSASGDTEGLNPTGGGGGSGGDSTTARQAGSGGSIQDYTSTNTILAAAAGGIETGTVAGTDGTAFAQSTTSRGWLAGGSGGGGGGGMKSTGPGKGGDGGTPGGGGGGGGGSINGTNSGVGGIGARGEIWVIEYA